MTNALSVSNITKSYKNGPLALNNLSLDIKEGDIFALLGQNGAGKSTLIGIISSLVRKDKGSVKVFGYDLDTHREVVKSLIGLVPQEFNFNVFEKSEDILITQAGYYGVPFREAKTRARYFLDKLGLNDKAQTPARLLSGGMKRRLMVARALVNHPKLLILDEPTAGVDIELRRTIWDFIQEVNEKGTTVILTTHYLEEAESFSKNIAIINGGEIVQQSSKASLLASLNEQTVVLDIQNSITEVPIIDGYTFKLIDSHTLEVSFSKEQPLNRCFTELDKQGHRVVSLRNKTNRLEEVFLKVVSND